MRRPCDLHENRCLALRRKPFLSTGSEHLDTGSTGFAPPAPAVAGGFYLLKARRGRARESVASQGHTVVGGEETPIVHATDHSFKATSVMIASAGL